MLDSRFVIYIVIVSERCNVGQRREREENDKRMIICEDVEVLKFNCPMKMISKQIAMHHGEVECCEATTSPFLIECENSRDKRETEKRFRFNSSARI